jgi:predicted DNA-binding protein (MmcQ/YjbR family)
MRGVSRYADAIRELALSLPETYEDHPWGHPVFKVRGSKVGTKGISDSPTSSEEPARNQAKRERHKHESANRMFASMNEDGDIVHLTVKLTAEEREMAQLHPYVSTARYVGRYGWVTAEVTDEESLDCALEWLRESYWLKCPEHLRAAVEGE